MNTQRIQFNRQKVAALLFTGLILAAALAWIGAEARAYTFQPVKMGQDCPYSRQPGYIAPSATVIDCARANSGKGESGSPAWSPLKSIKGARGGHVGEVHK